MSNPFLFRQKSYYLEGLTVTININLQDQNGKKNLQLKKLKRCNLYLFLHL